MERIIFKNHRKLKGIVNEVAVKEGDTVFEGQKLAIISTQGEKYKVLAHKAGVIKSVNIIESLLVSSGDIIFELEVKNDEVQNFENKFQSQDKTMRFSLLSHNNDNFHNDIPTDENFNLSDTFKFDETDDYSNSKDEDFNHLDSEISEDLFFNNFNSRSSNIDKKDNSKEINSKEVESIEKSFFNDSFEQPEKKDNSVQKNENELVMKISDKLNENDKVISDLKEKIYNLESKISDNFIDTENLMNSIKDQNNLFIKEKQLEIESKIENLIKTPFHNADGENFNEFVFKSDIKLLLQLENILKLKFYTKKLTLNIGSLLILAVYKSLKNEGVILKNSCIVHIKNNTIFDSKVDLVNDVNLLNIVKSYEQKDGLSTEERELAFFDLIDSPLENISVDFSSKIKIFFSKLKKDEESNLEIKFVFSKHFLDINKALRIVAKINYLIENPGFLI